MNHTDYKKYYIAPSINVILDILPFVLYLKQHFDAKFSESLCTEEIYNCCDIYTIAVQEDHKLSIINNIIVNYNKKSKYKIKYQHKYMLPYYHLIFYVSEPETQLIKIEKPIYEYIQNICDEYELKPYIPYDYHKKLLLLSYNTLLKYFVDDIVIMILDYTYFINFLEVI